jgi:arginine/lysine/ornithine decarboxylase/CheY-like chemotaxis protein
MSLYWLLIWSWLGSMGLKRMKPSEQPMRALIVDDEFHENTAAGRRLRALAQLLEDGGVAVTAASTINDGAAVVGSDASLQCVLLDWDIDGGADGPEAKSLLGTIRSQNRSMPVFLLTDRSTATSISAAVMQQADDFIWLLEDTPSFVAGRIIAAIKRYQDQLLPPMFRALVGFSEIHEYSWHTPGHTGGTGFLKSPVGQAFFSFFGENLLRSDLSVSVAELGSLLDHSGPIGAGEAYAASVFGADRTYYVTNGTSTSNRVVLMANVTRGQATLCDRNCHKSIEHAMTLTGGIPTYLIPTRNHLGIIGPVHPASLAPAAIKRAIADNPLMKDEPAKSPVFAVLTNSTYDGLCYNVARVQGLLGQSVDRMLFDEAWFGYARFNPMYRDRFAMAGDPGAAGRDAPTVFATQSTHKLLAALSQASMIHVRDGRRPIPHARFNEAFMMHASTSPQYAIIASNDVSAAMMDGSGVVLTTDAIREAVAFRQMMARLQAEFAEEKKWFFGVWQPDTVRDAEGDVTAFFVAPPERLIDDPACWLLAPNAAWHGFGDIEKNYCMLDPIKVSVVTQGADFGMPASLVTAYLDQQGIIPEKTADYTILFLFSIGVTKGKWGTLINALLDFKRDYDENAPLTRVLSALVKDHLATYGKLGLKDLANAMWAQMRELDVGTLLEQAFGTLSQPVFTPVQAYEQLVLGNVEQLSLAEMEGRVLATGIVPYPPGIPLLMPGEAAGKNSGPALAYLRALEQFDRLFPGFTHDIHGVESIEGSYHALCLKAPALTH